MTYISLFSGIGGLEHPDKPPLIACEIDPFCWPALKQRFPDTPIDPNVTHLHPPHADAVVGGWPCQDLSIAGKKAGLAGKKSSLFFSMLQITKKANAHTLIAENVPHLLKLNQGKEFHTVVESLHEYGFPHIAWRTLNAREFGLPHHRKRLILTASKHQHIARALHRPIPHYPITPSPHRPPTCGFYWTAGIHSICYNEGFIPTLKVGSSLSIPSPPALIFNSVVRKATATECLRLQGFKNDLSFIPDKHLYRMAGNAVAVPIGHFATECLTASNKTSLPTPTPIEPYQQKTTPCGYSYKGKRYQVDTPANPLAINLSDFIDHTNVTTLSPRAASGLLARLKKSKKPCPEALFNLLCQISLK